MKAPVSWLREVAGIAPTVTVAEIASRLTAAGITVEHIISTGSEVTGPLTIGKVLTKTDEPQKNGKTVHYVRVDVGPAHNDPASDDFPASRGIVCGAHNFEEGDLVVVALPGTVLPGDFAIAARKTYGHMSDGMICSAAELGLGEDHDGIIVLSDSLGLAAGDDALDALWTPDEVLEIDITPDLGYALSMRGLGRDVAQLFGKSFRDPYGTPVPAPSDAGYPIVLADPGCPCLSGCALTGSTRGLAHRLGWCNALRLRECALSR